MRGTGDGGSTAARKSFAASPSAARTFVVHVVVGAVILAVVASVAVFMSERMGRDQALRQPVAGGEEIATRIVAPLVTTGIWDGRPEDMRALDDRVQIRKSGSPIKRIKVWSPGGIILYSDDPRLIGRRLPLAPEPTRALASQGVESSVVNLSRSGSSLDRPLGESVEVSVGTRDQTGRPILVQTYFSVDRLEADRADLTRRIVTLLLVSFLALGVLLVPLAYSLARRMSRTAGGGVQNS